jgi:putative nucleotidyltransferase with HDIG domain
MLNVHITFSLAIFTFLLTLAILFLYLKNPGNVDFWYNFLFFLSSSAGLFGLYCVEVNTIPAYAPFWTRFIYAGYSGAVYAFPLYVATITRRPLGRYLRTGFSVTSLFLIFLILFTDKIISNRPLAYGRYFHAERGALYPVFATLFVGVIVYSFVQLVRYGRNDSERPIDFRPVFVGATLAILLGFLDLYGNLIDRPVLNFLPHPSVLAIFICVVSFTFTFLSQYSWVLHSLTKSEREVEQLIAKSNRNFIEFVQLIAKTLDAKDHYTAGHSLRVMDYAVKIARVLKIPESEVEVLKHACLLHDIGKICIPDGILNKKSSLSDHDREHIIKHPIVGRQILSTVSDFQNILDIIYTHHERVDGQGYPKGLRREEIPILARILSVADAFDAMCSERPYRKAKTREQAIVELKKASGTQLDEQIVEAFVNLVES